MSLNRLLLRKPGARLRQRTLKGPTLSEDHSFGAAVTGGPAAFASTGGKVQAAANTSRLRTGGRLRGNDQAQAAGAIATNTGGGQVLVTYKIGVKVAVVVSESGNVIIGEPVLNRGQVLVGVRHRNIIDVAPRFRMRTNTKIRRL